MKKFLPTFIAVLLSASSFAQKTAIDVLTIVNVLPNDNSGPSNFLLLFDNDGGVSGINSIPSYQCNASIIPSVVIENFGTNNLTTATLVYFIDGGSPAYLDWEGSLPPFFTDTIELPTLDVDPGTHTLTIKVTEANGQVDINGGNNNSIQFNIVGASVPAPYAESFEAPQLPDGYFVQNVNSGSSWVVTDATGNLNSLGCLFMPFYTNDVEGDQDDLYMKNVDLSGLSETTLRFDVAYAYYSKFYYDELKVAVSADCGGNWDVLYDKMKDDLATASFTDLPFVPTTSQWRSEAIDMNSYSGFGNVLIRFEAISGHGNNLYIDNIGIDQNVGVEEAVGNTSLSVYPNPANDVVKISLPQNLKSDVMLTIINEVGEQVFELNAVSGQPINISSVNFPSGNYFVEIREENSAPLIARLTILH